MIKKMVICGVAWLVGISIAPSALSWGVSDSLAFKRVGRVVASPDGKQIVFVVLKIISKNGKKLWSSTLYLKKQNNHVVLLSKNQQDVSMPRWSPDGKSIAYLNKGKHFESIWVQPLTANNAQKLVELNRDILSFKWSHDGKQIAFVSAVKKKPKTSLIDVQENYTNLQLYRIQAAGQNNTPQVITPDTTSISILVPYTSGGFDWSANDKSIVYAYQPQSGAAYGNFSKLAIINLESRKIQEIPYTQAHTGNQPLVSPDGRWVAFRSNLKHFDSATMLNNNSDLNNRICVTNISTLKTHCLNNTFNENPLLVGWRKDSGAVFVSDNVKATMLQFYALNLDNRIANKILSNVNVFINPATVSLNRTHTVFGFAVETPKNPPEPFTSNSKKFQLKPVTTIQAPSNKPSGKIQTIHWASTDGKTIEGLLMTPPGYDRAHFYPLLVALHGGPAGVWPRRYVGGCWEFGKTIMPICWSDLLSKGFVIFQPNPRGSTGYGRAFRTANFKDLGGGDYHDVMSGIDYLIKKGIADSNHLALFGWSYGGYLTAWAVTQTHRFKAAVDGAGLTDLIAFTGTTDIPFYLRDYLGAWFWKSSDLYLQRSPIMHVANVTTPVLIMDGQHDTRVPVSQSKEFYTALKYQHKTVKWLMLPKQHHAPRDPAIIEPAIINIEAWLDKALH